MAVASHSAPHLWAGSGLVPSAWLTPSKQKENFLGEFSWLTLGGCFADKCGQRDCIAQCAKCLRSLWVGRILLVGCHQAKNYNFLGEFSGFGGCFDDKMPTRPSHSAAHHTFPPDLA